MIRDALYMLKETAKHPKTAALGITSAANARRIARKIDWNTPKTVVEYGGGTGPITRALLTEITEHPHVAHRLIVLEIHAELAEKLRTIRHPQLTVIERDVGDIIEILADMHITAVDAIISGIPLSLLPNADEIVASSAKLLGKHGQMIVYQYRPTAGKLLKRHFGKVQQQRISPMLRLYEAKF